MRERKNGFTMVELLTTITIMALLMGLLIPAISLVRKTAKETQQRSQFTTIDMALTSFRNDYGSYPSSSARDSQGAQYCGAEKLAEALLGQDLLGFHPWSEFREDGLGDDPRDSTYSPEDLYPDNLNPAPNTADERNIKMRKGPYLEVDSAKAFKLGDLFGNGSTAPLDPCHFVICDVYGVKTVSFNEQIFKAGTPILYHRANTASKTMAETGNTSLNIYDCRDNYALIRLRKLNSGDPHALENNGGLDFYNDWRDTPPYKIIDPKASTATLKWPHRPDSYILISAGYDGEYGTEDDIFNF